MAEVGGEQVDTPTMGASNPRPWDVLRHQSGALVQVDYPIRELPFADRPGAYQGGFPCRYRRPLIPPNSCFCRC